VIIRRQEESLLFVTQPDHAVMAAELVAHIQGFAANPRRDEIHLAVLEHDNGWQELDQDLVFDAGAGAALDFISVPDAIKRAVWPMAIDRVAPQSAYAAALIAEHAIFVYANSHASPDWQPFFTRIEQRRAELLALSGITLEILRSDYPLLALADLLSLVFCHGWTDRRERFGHTVRCEGGAVTMTPSRLPAAPVPVRVKARRVPARRYASVRALRDALAAAPVEFLTGTARGGTTP
jgi:hypothetical protein